MTRRSCLPVGLVFHPTPTVIRSNLVIWLSLEPGTNSIMVFGPILKLLLFLTVLRDFFFRIRCNSWMKKNGYPASHACHKMADSTCKCLSTKIYGAQNGSIKVNQMISKYTINLRSVQEKTFAGEEPLPPT